MNFMKEPLDIRQGNSFGKEERDDMGEPDDME